MSRYVLSNWVTSWEMCSSQINWAGIPAPEKICAIQKVEPYSINLNDNPRNFNHLLLLFLMSGTKPKRPLRYFAFSYRWATTKFLSRKVAPTFLQLHHFQTFLRSSQHLEWDDLFISHPVDEMSKGKLIFGPFYQ